MGALKIKHLGGSGPPPPRKKPRGKNLTSCTFLVRRKKLWEKPKQNPAHVVHIHTKANAPHDLTRGDVGLSPKLHPALHHPACQLIDNNRRLLTEDTAE